MNVRDWMSWCAAAANGRHPEARDCYGRPLTGGGFPGAAIDYWLDAYERNTGRSVR